MSGAQKPTDNASATALTLASIIIPNWISFENHTVSNAPPSIAAWHNTDLYRTIIHTSTTPMACIGDAPARTHTLQLSSPSSPLTIHEHLNCVPFLRSSDCHGDDRYFCSMWRSIGFLMSLGVVVEGMTIAAFLILLLGDKQRREQGWAVLSIMVAIAAAVQAAGMSITVRQLPIAGHRSESMG